MDPSVGICFHLSYADLKPVFLSSINCRNTSKKQLYYDNVERTYSIILTLFQMTASGVKFSCSPVYKHSLTTPFYRSPQCHAMSKHQSTLFNASVGHGTIHPGRPLCDFLPCLSRKRDNFPLILGKLAPNFLFIPRVFRVLLTDIEFHLLWLTPGYLIALVTR